MLYEVGDYWHVRRVRPPGVVRKPPMFWVERATSMTKLADGLKAADLPLYRAEDIGTFDRAGAVFVCEGEKATDACQAARASGGRHCHRGIRLSVSDCPASSGGLPRRADARQ